ncbi:MAG: sporulation protein YtfJ [Clostridia bacterium]|nr:sporulation protein YtfJ [Clostridia bacterium]
MPETKISEIIKAALGNVRETADASTIIGDPITTANGTTILPVSKVAVGVATGGLDYNPKNETAQPGTNFGGGGGTGLTVTPVGFLVVKQDGTVELLNINNPTDGNNPVNAIMSLVGKAPDLFSKIKSSFGKKKNKDDAEEISDRLDDVEEKIDDLADTVE